MNKSQILGWFLTISTVFDTVWGIVSENAGLLADFGVSPKVTKIIMALSIIFTAFNKSLKPTSKPQSLTDDEIGLPIPRDPKKT
jgi:hypothetical protein